MLAFDTNIFLYAANSSCAEHSVARHLLTQHALDTEVVICELVLVELYSLLRNSRVLQTPLDASSAVTHCEAYRRNPHWRLVDSAPIMNAVWLKSAENNFSRRRIFDVRLALVLQHHGVGHFVTRNVRDFADLGFATLTNPFSP